MQNAIDSYIILLKKSMKATNDRDELQRLERLIKAAREIKNHRNALLVRESA